MMVKFPTKVLKSLSIKSFGHDFKKAVLMAAERSGDLVFCCDDNGAVRFIGTAISLT